MDVSTSTLTPFPKEGTTLRSGWNAWERLVLDDLEAATAHVHGLLGFAVSAARLAELTGINEAVHAPLQHPGVLADDATQGATAVHRYKMEQFEKQQTALKQAKTRILACLNEEALDLVTEAGFGTRRRTIQDILDILRANYGLISVAEIQQQKNRLKVPYQANTPIRDYIRVHREVHEVLAMAGQDMAMADKVAELRAGVKHVPQLGTAVQHFITTNPTLAAQTFAKLTTLLGEAEDNGEPQPTTGSAGYAAASMASPTVVSMDVVVQMVAAAVGKAMAEKDKRQPPSTRIAAPKKKNYCWSHGPCAHPSLDCKNPREGHIWEATDTNRQGGADVRYSAKRNGM